jgi:replicative DNA helicase
VVFSDGTTIVADAQHQWRTTTRASRRAERAQSSLSWPPKAVRRVREAGEGAKAGPDRPVTHREAVGALGEELRHVPHTVRKEIGSVGTVPIEVGGPSRGRHIRHTPAYPAARLFGGLYDRVVTPKVVTPKNGATTRRHRSVVTTEEIAQTLRCDTADRRPNHAVAVAAPFQLDEQDLPLAPYALGVWLGDGDSANARFSTTDPEIIANLESEGIRVRRVGSSTAHHTKHGTVQGILRSLGVLGNKHIPAVYLRASERQRRELLAGLLDTDGYINSSGQIEFAVTDERLARDAYELIVSLGHRASLRTKPVKGRSPASSVCYVINFTAPVPVFRLPRKAARQVTADDPTTRVRYIVDVRPIRSQPVRCVEVDNDDHMYLASRACIPTHNSTLGLDFARSAAIKHGMTTVIFSLEMSRNEITMRLLSAEARVALHTMRSGMMGDDDWTRLARRMSEVAEAPLFIDDSPNMSMMEIRAKCRRLKQRNDLRFVIIDYLQLMSSPKKSESRQNEVSEISRAIKLLAKELEVPVIAISQLNRGPEQRTDKRPQVSDLRESGSIEQDADMVILLHREDAYERESPRAGEADLIVAKHRNGPTATVTVAFQGHYSRFVDMAQH